MGVARGAWLALLALAGAAIALPGGAQLDSNALMASPVAADGLNQWAQTNVSVLVKTEVPVQVVTAHTFELENEDEGADSDDLFVFENSSLYEESNLVQNLLNESGSTVRKSPDRVALFLRTDDMLLTFNVGPFLNNTGLSVRPNTQARALAADSPPLQDVIVSDGAVLVQLDGQAPIINLAVSSWMLNYTFDADADGNVVASYCYRNASLDGSEGVPVLAQRFTVNTLFDANLDIKSVQDISEAFTAVQGEPMAMDPEDTSGKLFVSLVSPETGMATLVSAERLFSLGITPEQQQQAVADQEPACQQYFCDGDDVACLDGIGST